MINQGLAANRGGGGAGRGAGGGGGGRWTGGGGGGGLVPFTLSPGYTKDYLVIGYQEKLINSLSNSWKEAMANKFDMSHKNTVIFESEMKAKHKWWDGIQPHKEYSPSLMMMET